MAGTIEYLAPIKSASGMILGKKEKFIAVKRQSGKRLNGCAVVGKRNLIDNPYSESELTRQSKFSAVTKKVAQRASEDSATYIADIAAFAAQRDQPDGIKRFRKWLWHDEWKKL